MKRDDKDNSQVKLAKIGGKMPKYATIEYVDAKFNELRDELKVEARGLNSRFNKLEQEMLSFKQEVNNEFDALSDLVVKIAQKVGV
ncbi:MAG: hypothetical protein LBF00_03600 [Mycoplasmataceae bacterium]|nr:hypothetical protein [Mycoplasmataceae bacterium]